MVSAYSGFLLSPAGLTDAVSGLNEVGTMYEMAELQGLVLATVTNSAISVPVHG